MRKLIPSLLATLIIFSGSVALAKTYDPGNPFDAIWNEIQAIYEKIATLELIPGPAGENGIDGLAGTDGNDGLNCWDLNSNAVCDLLFEDIDLDSVCSVSDCRGVRGEAGIQGEAGEPGKSAELLKTYDAKGQELGLTIEARYDGRYVSYIPEIDMLVEFENANNKRVKMNIPIVSVYYSKENCQGDRFSPEEIKAQVVLRGPAASGSYYRMAHEETPQNRTSLSYETFGAGNCSNERKELNNTYLLEPVELPFALPVLGPLEVGY